MLSEENLNLDLYFSKETRYNHIYGPQPLPNQTPSQVPNPTKVSTYIHTPFLKFWLKK